MIEPRRSQDGYFECPLCGIRGRRWAIVDHINRDHWPHSARPRPDLTSAPLVGGHTKEDPWV